ncbi:MAG: phosphate signaling complex protein PhoU, partial [Actinobacteria bacterium]|nr:phosphate signaling complex protein PhoU [Actinomycetota bacterium]
MLRKSFHDELKDLEEVVLEMGKAARQAIENAIKVVVNCDVELADEVIALDDEIDRLNYEIEEQSMAIIARQAPVARDLRLCWSILFIALHLERMADLSVNMAKGAKRVCPTGIIPELTDHIDEMGQETLVLVDACLKSFRDKDPELAVKLAEMDDPVDHMHRKIFKKISNCRNHESIEWIGNVL